MSITANEDVSSSAECEKKPVRGYIDGCFDLMHQGHYNAIRQAKQLCDVLVVGIHSDEQIRINKATPVMTETERYALLQHIKWIDEVIYDVPYSPSMETLERANAEFAVHGDDMPISADGRGTYDQMRDAGKLRIVKRTEGISTTELIGRLLLVCRSHLNLTATDQNFPREPSTSTSVLTTTRRIADFGLPQRVPSEDDVIVYVSGVFDMFHVGHASLLAKARSFGTFLLVGIHDDVASNKLKGANSPIMNLLDRVLCVSACKHVNEVLISAPLVVTEDLVRTFGVSIVVEGTPVQEFTSEKDDRFLVPRRKGILRALTSDFPELHTHVIADRVATNWFRYSARNKRKAQKESDH